MAMRPMVSTPWRIGTQSTTTIKYTILSTFTELRATRTIVSSVRLIHCSIMKRAMKARKSRTHGTDLSDGSLGTWNNDETNVQPIMTIKPLQLTKQCE